MHERVFSEGPTKEGILNPDLTAPAGLTTFTNSHFGGTSSSTPVAGGVAALLRALKPSSTAAQVEVALETSLAVDLGTIGKDAVWGSGRLVLSSTPPSPFTFSNQCAGFGSPTTLQPLADPTAPPGDLVGLFGTGFGPNATVFVGGKKIPTSRSSDTLVGFYVPTLPNGNYPVRVLNPEGCRSLETRILTIDSSDPACGLLGIEPLVVLLLLARRKSWRFFSARAARLAGVVILTASVPNSAGAQSITCPAGAQPRERDLGDQRELWCVKTPEGGTGLDHGPYLAVLKTGQRKLEGSFERGQRVGTWRSWYDSGTLSSEVEYRAGLTHGRSVTYFESGRVSVLGYNKLGKRDGQWTRYFADGVVQLEQRFVEGVQEGEEKLYYETGQLHQRGNFRDGTPDGVWTTWHANGEKAEEGVAKDGLRHDTWSFWDESGRLSETLAFQRGVTSSPRREGAPAVLPGVRWAPQGF